MSSTRENELVFLIKNASHELNNYIRQAEAIGLRVELLVKPECKEGRISKAVTVQITKVF